MNFDEYPSKKYSHIKQFVLIDIDQDCDLVENLFEYFPKLTNIHLDLNQFSFISDQFVQQIPFGTHLSLSDNPRLKSWDPFINRLGKLQHLEELI